MNPDALFVQPSVASADAGGIAVAGDTLAAADSHINVFSGGLNAGVGVATANALASDLDGLNFELAGVSTLAAAGSVLGEEFSAGSAATFGAVAGPSGIEIEIDTNLDIDFSADVSVGSATAIMPDFGALSFLA